MSKLVSELPLAFEILFSEIEKESALLSNGLNTNNQSVLKILVDNLKTKVSECQSDCDIISNWAENANGGSDESRELMANEEEDVFANPVSTRNYVGGCKRNVLTRQSSIKFRVVFDDGTIIEPCQFSYETFMKACEKFGEEKIAKLGWTWGSEPIITKNANDFVKYRDGIKMTKNGWYVQSIMSSKYKMLFIEAFGKAFKTGVKCEIVY